LNKKQDIGEVKGRQRIFSLKLGSFGGDPPTPERLSQFVVEPPLEVLECFIERRCIKALNELAEAIYWCKSSARENRLT
jgi:hypothetical protein